VAAALAPWRCAERDSRVSQAGLELGFVGCAVGSAFAVLVGRGALRLWLRPSDQHDFGRPARGAASAPYFVLIERALRDEATSYHYLPPAEFSSADAGLLAATTDALLRLQLPVERGAVWTTDVPFRETQTAITAMKAKGLLAVEMEAAAFYAFAEARCKPVLCFAHVTNRMATIAGDFEKGEADRTVDALAIITTAARVWQAKAI
jgi:hypothetical protein